ncbi:E3 ubiquitin-protein ligase TRIM56-like [Haliotis asinina]|uniref:E3 ubiquitin-protein ligase TRIM56-like n=1 Tax=Haliotis asinina TaxID=109174 RepID=UPI0035320FAA
MAAALPDPSVADSLQSDFLTCGICHELFTDPRILPCLHSICLNCLRTQRLGHCPQCREPISAEVDSFKKNFFINGLTELAKSKSAKSNQCTPCRLTGRFSLAAKKCLSCRDDLCSKCACGHNASTQTFSHQIVSLEDFWEGLHDAQFREAQRLGCPQHPDKHVDYFCQCCRAPVCISCIVLLHKDHNTQPLEEAAMHVKSRMSSKVQIVREEFNLISIKEMNILSLIESLKSQKELETSVIEENAKREIAKLHNRKLDAINKLSAETKERVTEHNTRLQELSQHKRKISGCVSFCDSILDTAKDEELLMMKTTIMSRLQHIKGYAVASLQKDALTFANDDMHSKKQDKTQDIGQKSETASSVPVTKTDSPRYTIKFQGTLATKFKGDSYKPNIKGTAYCVSAGLLISDLANGKVKMINSKGDLKQVITMDEFHPRAVAAAGDTIAVISENYMCIFTSKGNLRTKVKVQKTKPDESLPFTYSLAASEDVGIVVGNIHGVKRLHVYNLNGTMNRYLDFHVSFPLASLSVSPAKDIVISEWGSGCLRVVSTEGKARWTSRECNYGWKPNGTCVSADGTVVVADYDWGGVRVYSSSGEKSLEYRTKPDGLYCPSHVVLDELGSLYVIDAKGGMNKYTLGSKH